jgi:hypothetical protein
VKLILYNLQESRVRAVRYLLFRLNPGILEPFLVKKREEF